VTSSRFYAELPVFTDFTGVTRPESFAPLPDDWHVVMSDVRNSTVAVQSGNYKHVNTLGAATITAVLNAAGPIEIPFVFEGDGAVLCIPPELLDAARAALLQTRDMAQRSFHLDLRIATLAVARIREAGYDVRVARYKASEAYVQAVYSGGGVAFADRFMKDPAHAAQCAVEAGNLGGQASFEGLECRWQDIPSTQGETVCVMVKALATDGQAAAAVYREVIAKVRSIYGSDEQCHPISATNLSAAFGSQQLGSELLVRAGGRSRIGRWLYLMRIRWFVLLGWFLMKYGIRTDRTDWGRYKETVVRNADVRKFSDLYRQILCGGAAQREALSAWLDERLARRDLVYGMHVADRAHMTCLVFDYSGRHLHFIDGADGGLFLAAKAFKQRLAALAPPSAQKDL
jgi:predicted NAD-dependent protein-ADP-ribosyltransferase YbiA (DUF1768 family)